MNLKEKSISLFDRGDPVFSSTSLSTVAKAVTRVFTHLEQMENRAIYVQDTTTTLKERTAMGKNAAGADGWKESIVQVGEILEQAWAELKKEKPKREIFIMNFLGASIFGEGYGSHFENRTLNYSALGRPATLKSRGW